MTVQREEARLAGGMLSIDRAGIGAAVLGAALFSTKPILIKFAYAEGIDALTLLALRMLLSLPFYVVIGAFVWKKAPSLSPVVLAAIAANGLLGYFLASYLDFLALEDITAQLERLVLFTYPIFVVFLGAFFFGQPLRRWTLPAVVVAYAGLASVFVGNMQHAGGDHIMRGTLLVAGAALCFSLFQLFGRRLVDRVGAALYTSIAMTSAGFGLLTHFVVMRPLADLVVPTPVLGIAFCIALLSTVAPSYLVNYALGRIGADGTAMVGNAGPLFTMGMAAVLLGEPFGPLELTGTALVIGGMVLFSRR